MSTCPAAEILRLRAQNIAVRFAQSKDERVRALADAMQRAYQALAENEEWLAGVVAPAPVSATP